MTRFMWGVPEGYNDEKHLLSQYPTAKEYFEKDPLLILKPGETLDDVLARGREFTTDDPSKIGTGAIKYDGGKPALWRGVFEYFPRAISAVGDISTFGARKYAWAGWEGVEDGIARYSDAMVRHLAKEGAGEVLDPDSGLLHAAHTAWGSLARLELILREQEKSISDG